MLFTPSKASPVFSAVQWMTTSLLLVAFPAKAKEVRLLSKRSVEVFRTWVPFSKIYLVEDLRLAVWKAQLNVLQGSSPLMQLFVSLPNWGLIVITCSKFPGLFMFWAYVQMLSSMVRR